MAVLQKSQSITLHEKKNQSKSNARKGSLPRMNLLTWTDGEDAELQNYNVVVKNNGFQGDKVIVRLLNPMSIIKDRL